ncbi:hypothetical protein [Paenibacillus sp. NPDC057967]|uniref:hypothetical protein n=1 Tax=Paenibacillus sp. NPDC057967 TaxID=3346293 RepID=UPI0036DE0F17
MQKRRPSTFIQPEILEDYLEYLTDQVEKGEEFATLSIHQISSLITAYLELLRK